MHCPAVPPLRPVTQVEGKQHSSSVLHIPNLGVHVNGKLGRKKNIVLILEIALFLPDIMSSESMML